jgi:hypothetical protein
MKVNQFERKSKASTLQCIVLICITLFSFQTSAQQQGVYFAKKKYTPSPLFKFNEVKDKLPHPIYDEDQAYVDCYWRVWNIAFKNFYHPTPESGFVSNFADAAFSDNIYQWDDCFISMFLNYGHKYVPSIITLDNFYAKQYKDGEICREIARATGKDRDLWQNKEGRTLFSRFGDEYDGNTFAVQYRGRETPKQIPHLTLDALQHPLFAWAELESYKMTGDKARLKLVWEPLVRYYGALKYYLTQGNGLYVTDWASMDNSTRNPYLKDGGCGVDISAEMVLFGNQLAEIATVLNKPTDAAKYRKEAAITKKKINELMWDDKESFYYDLTVDGEKIKIKTVAAFWPLLAGVADAKMAKGLVAELNNPETFNRKHRVPTLAANEKGYDPMGGYWKGAVWAPINTMVVKGLETSGYNTLAKEIAMNHLDNVVKIFKTTGTVWENYSPDSLSCGYHEGRKIRDEFVGWTGIGPIRYFIEYAIGIKANALTNTIDWKIGSKKRVGVEKFWFNNNTVSLVSSAVDANGNRVVKVKSEKPFTLKVSGANTSKTVKIQANKLVAIKV